MVLVYSRHESYKLLRIKVLSCEVIYLGHFDFETQAGAQTLFHPEIDNPLKQFQNTLDGLGGQCLGKGDPQPVGIYLSNGLRFFPTKGGLKEFYLSIMICLEPCCFWLGSDVLLP